MGGKGSGGHNRKSAAQRKVEGNAGKRAINDREPVPPAVSIAMPARLTLPEKQYWLQIFPIVTAMKIMTSADVLPLVQLCRALAEEDYWTTIIRKKRSLRPGKLPMAVALLEIPECARLRSSAAKEVRTYLAVFGLGPSFRAALHVDPSDDPPQDPLENVRRAKTTSDRVH